MFSRFAIRNASSWTMLLFGIAALALGAAGILRPETLLIMLGFDVIERSARAAHDYTLVFVVASSMASFNMGVYYILAAFNNMKKFYLWTVPFRCVTFTVFTLMVLSGMAPTRFIIVGLWELVGAVFTGMALYYEYRRGVAQTVTNSRSDS